METWILDKVVPKQMFFGFLVIKKWFKCKGLFNDYIVIIIPSMGKEKWVINFSKDNKEAKKI